MKTNPTKKNHPMGGIAWLPKLLLFSALAFFISLPMADARPHHRHHGHGHGHHHHHRHHGHGHHHHRGHYHQHHYHGARHVHRGWSRPGFYGAYPPGGHVTYRYIHTLPRGYRVVHRYGRPYYYVNGAYYWPARYNNRGVYIQVNL